MSTETPQANQPDFDPALAGLSALGRVHFLGMAGVGVSAVARLMQGAGVPISGTDAKELPVLEELRAAGAAVRVGYSAENIGSVEAETGESISTVIASSIAKAGNSEYDEAVRRGLTVLHRSEGLAATMAGRRAVAVAGTHGKTTTSSMTAVLLTEAGADPTFAVGAAVAGLGTNAKAGSGDWFVAEADESDGSLLNYAPEVAVVTNVEADHLDHHGTAEAVHQVFVDFTERITDGGQLIICADDAGARRLLEDVGGRLAARGVDVVTYGFSAGTDLRITDHRAAGDGSTGQELTVEVFGRPLAVGLAVPGRYNACNALAALAVGLRAGLAPELCAEALARFRGAARRFDFQGEVSGVRVYDDYAHHPTEVAAVLQAARSAVGQEGRVHAIFQPHLFSRTQLFAADFAEALRDADSVAVLEIYPAREEPVSGVTAELISGPLFAPPSSGARVPHGARCSEEEAVRQVAREARPGDVILTLGAGDVTATGPRIIEALRG